MATSDRIAETDIIEGRWDNAAVELRRVNWADTSQRVLIRFGAVGQIRRGRVAFIAEVCSLAQVLNQTVGRAEQVNCDAAPGDGRCGLDLQATALKGSGAVLGTIRDRGFVASGLGTFALGWFTSGTVEWTSGGSAGRRSEVMIHEVADTGVTITMLQAHVRALGVGYTDLSDASQTWLNDVAALMNNRPRKNSRTENARRSRGRRTRGLRIDC